jgi:hypothetical protein
MLIIWIFWYAHVVAERISRSIYEAQVSEVRRKAESTSGVMYWLGCVIYAPYLQPVKSFVVWLIAVVLSFVLA